MNATKQFTKAHYISIVACVLVLLFQALCLVCINNYAWGGSGDPFPEYVDDMKKFNHFLLIAWSAIVLVKITLNLLESQGGYFGKPKRERLLNVYVMTLVIIGFCVSFVISMLSTIV